MYYTIRNECGKTIKSISELKTSLANHPQVVEYDQRIELLNNRILELTNGVKNTINNNKKRIQYLKGILKYDLNDLEKNVVKLTIKDEKKTMAKVIKTQRNESNKAIILLKKKLNETKKIHVKKYKSLRKTLKIRISYEKKQEKVLKKAEKQTRKALRKQEDYEEQIDHELLKGLQNKYSKKIDEELQTFDTDLLEKIKEKEEEKNKKEIVKEKKKREKEDEKLQKEIGKEKNKLEKERIRKSKKLVKEREREQIKKGKLLNKTRKKIAKK